MTDGPLDCVTCGACCFSARPDYIEVFAVDRARMDGRALALTVLRDGRGFMRSRGGMSEQHCAALEPDSLGRFPCSIYEVRPDACRWLVPGSGECHDQRTHKLAQAASCVEKLRSVP